MPTFGNIFRYTHFEIEYPEIFYYGLTDDLTYVIFDIQKGTIKIVDDDGECGSEKILGGSERYPVYPNKYRFGDLFSYTKVNMEYSNLIYDDIDDGDSYAVINIEDGSVRINGETFLLIQTF